MPIVTRVSRLLLLKKKLNFTYFCTVLLFLLLHTLLCKAQTKRCSSDYDSSLSKSTVTFIETAPKFPGGDEGLFKFLKTELSPLVKSSSYKSVFFIIDTSGQVRNVCIVTDLIRKELSETEKKIINVFQTMPKWEPAISENQKASIYFTMPLNSRYK